MTPTLRLHFREPTIDTKATVLAERETKARLAVNAALSRPNGG